MDNLPNSTPSEASGQAPLNPSVPPNPPNPSNANVDPVQSWVAQHEQRDASGRFVKSEHLTNGQSQSAPTSQNSQSTPNLPLLFPSPKTINIQRKMILLW